MITEIGIFVHRAFKIREKKEGLKFPNLNATPVAIALK